MEALYRRANIRAVAREPGHSRQLVRMAMANPILPGQRLSKERPKPALGPQVFPPYCSVARELMVGWPMALAVGNANRQTIHIPHL